MLKLVKFHHDTKKNYLINRFILDLGLNISSKIPKWIYEWKQILQKGVKQLFKVRNPNYFTS